MHVWDANNHYICPCAQFKHLHKITWQKVYEIFPLSSTQDMKVRWKDSLHLTWSHLVTGRT